MGVVATRRRLLLRSDGEMACCFCCGCVRLKRTHRDMWPKPAVGRFRGNADSRKLCVRRIYEFAR